MVQAALPQALAHIDVSAPVSFDMGSWRVAVGYRHGLQTNDRLRVLGAAGETVGLATVAKLMADEAELAMPDGLHHDLALRVEKVLP